MARRNGPPANRAAQTAWGPIVQVALEQYVPRQQRIVQDPLAYRFLPVYKRLLVRAARPKAIRERLLAAIDRRIPGIRGGILCRKRYIDERLADALTSGLDAVVILGAGMDTRGCRLPRGGGVPVYEVDLPPNTAVKAATLRRVFGEVPAHIRFAPADLELQDVGSVGRWLYAGQGGFLHPGRCDPLHHRGDRPATARVAPDCWRRQPASIYLHPTRFHRGTRDVRPGTALSPDAH